MSHRPIPEKPQVEAICYRLLTDLQKACRVEGATSADRRSRASNLVFSSPRSLLYRLPLHANIGNKAEIFAGEAR